MPSRSELDAWFGQVREGVVFVREARCVYANASFAEMLDLSLSDLRDRALATLLPSEDRPSLEAWIGERDPAPVELRFVRRGGSRRLLALTPLTGVGPEGAAQGFTVRDVTDKRLLQSELLVADRMMSVGALAAGVAHDINNPLSYVLGNLEYLSAELPKALKGAAREDGRDFIEALGEAREGAERVRRIVSDLRAFARADSEGTQALDIPRLVESAVNMAFVEIRHRARLEKVLEPTPSVRANEARLGQVVLNLLLNAVHALPAGHQEKNKIRVRTYSEGHLACIEVSDNGGGIPPELIGRIFDPFFTTKPWGTGTGLGLAMAHGVVNELSGDVTVKSQLGQGTAFTVSLPGLPASARTAPRLPSDRSERVAPSARARVLVIDDDPLITSTLRRTLEVEGHGVSVCAGGAEALELLDRDADFDVVFCDLLMPGVTGMEVYGWVAVHRPELGPSFVFMSGGVFTEHVHRFLETRDNPRIDKPFAPGQAGEIVRAVQLSQSVCDT